MTTAALLVLFGALSRLLPHPPNAVALGALALYAGARLPRRWALLVPLAAMALSDFFLDFGTGRAAFGLVRAIDYAAFAGIVLLGRALARTARPLALGGLSVCGSVAFFLASNGAEWLSGGLYPKTAGGLALCLAAGVPFFWNTLAADLAGTALFFGLDGLARRRTAWPLAAGVGLALLAAAPARAQQLPPVSEDVVVTATLNPEEEKDLGSATTVITREEIEKSGRSTVLELLRSVPGLDVVRSGGDGSVTSVFLRGANSTQALVLVDGARMNSPFFAGYDFSNLTTENIERIEIVRGPFSALYGSDAIGGVIQIFTRAPQRGFSGQALAEGGNASTARAAAFVSAGSGPVGFSAAYRHGRTEGGQINSDFRQDNGAARIDWEAGPAVRLALEGSILDGEGGNPGPTGAENPQARGRFREERVALPATIVLAPDNRLTMLVASVWSKPGYDDPLAAYSSRTDARTLQARVSDTATLGRHTVTGVASWERWTVDNVDTFGTYLNGQRTTIWGVGAQDTVTVGSLTATGGVRYDRNSAFGDAVSPRLTLAWVSPGSAWKVRASGGSAFRAPTVGELYYPFGGNPGLKPERSVSWELGAEAYAGKGRAEVSLFWNDLRDLIVYDFPTNRNQNVGQARTRGVEVAWRQTLSESVALDVSYTYLDAQNRVTNLPLIRRPRHRGALGISIHPVAPLEVTARGYLVGRRPDADALTGAPFEDPSYLRLDFLARWDLGRLVPYARLENALERRYEEAAGYPAPGRRFAAGMEVKF